jgi:hypothetical protein
MARRGYDPDNPEAYEAQRNMLDLYGNYVQGPRTDRSHSYDLGLWGSAGVPMFEQLHGDESGVNFTENTPLTFTKGGQEMFRIGQRGKDIPPEWKKAGFDKQIKYDPTYGYYMPKDQFFAAQQQFPQEGLFSGPALLGLAGFGLPALIHAGVLGGIGAATGSQAAGGTVAGSGGTFAGGATLTPGTVAGAELGVGLGELAGVGPLVGPTMPTVAGLTGVGGLTAEGAAALGAMGSAGAGLGVGTTGPLGALTLDAAGNIVPALADLASSTGVLTGVGAGSGIGAAAGSAATEIAKQAAEQGGKKAGEQAAKTGLSKLLKDSLGIDVDPSTLDILGKLLGTGLGVYGANKQAESAEGLFNKFFQMGAPYRTSLQQLNENPESFYSSPMVQGALQQGSDALSRSLSAKVGNPILNPTALQEMQNYTTRGLLDAYGNRWNQLSSAGQLGVSQSAPLGLQANAAQGNVYNALGAGLGSVFNNQRDYTGELLDILRGRNGVGGFSLS